MDTHRRVVARREVTEKYTEIAGCAHDDPDDGRNPRHAPHRGRDDHRRPPPFGNQVLSAEIEEHATKSPSESRDDQRPIPNMCLHDDCPGNRHSDQLTERTRRDKAHQEDEQHEERQGRSTDSRADGTRRRLVPKNVSEVTVAAANSSRSPCFDDGPRKPPERNGLEHSPTDAGRPQTSACDERTHRGSSRT